MKKIIRLTESDLTRIVRKVLSEGIPQNKFLDLEKKVKEGGETTKKFQDWMDTKGKWVASKDPSGKIQYNTLNKRPGYGKFGPSTEAAWNKYGKEFSTQSTTQSTTQSKNKINFPQIKSLQDLLNFLKSLKEKYKIPTSINDFIIENPNNKIVLFIEDILKNAFEGYMGTEYNQGGGEISGWDYRYGTYVIPKVSCKNKGAGSRDLRILFKEFDPGMSIPTPTWSLQNGSSTNNSWPKYNAKNGAWFFSGGNHYMSYGTKFEMGKDPVQVIKTLLGGNLCA